MPSLPTRFLSYTKTFTLILWVIKTMLISSAYQSNLILNPIQSEHLSCKVHSFSVTFYSRIPTRCYLSMLRLNNKYSSGIMRNDLYHKSLGIITSHPRTSELYKATLPYKIPHFIGVPILKNFIFSKLVLLSLVMFTKYLTAPFITLAIELNPNQFLTSVSSVYPTKIPEIIKKYIQQNMFNDDIFDPFESAYREAINDGNTGTHSLDLYLTASAAIGKDALTLTSSPMHNSSILRREYRLFHAISSLVDYLHRNHRISKNMSYIVIFGTGLIIPIMLIGIIFLTFSFSQRAMTERMAVERYGESVLDATELKNIFNEHDAIQRNNTVI